MAVEPYRAGKRLVVQRSCPVDRLPEERGTMAVRRKASGTGRLMEATAIEQGVIVCRRSS